MATLSADKPRLFEYNEDPLLESVPAVTSDIIYEGAAIGDSSGYGRPLVGGDAFRGFAYANCDNSSGAAGAKNIKTRKQGTVRLSVTGVTAVTDEGSTVYATDDDTFTLTASGATAIGKITRWITGTYCMVYFQAGSVQSL